MDGIGANGPGSDLGPAFSQQDLSYKDSPALRPDVIRARIKQVYEKNLIGRTLMPVEPQDSDVVSWLKEGDIVGNVDWITEKGGFKMMDSDYTKQGKPIRPYGVQLDVTLMDRRLSRVQTVGRRIERMVNAMRRFEDDLIFNRIINATAANTFDGTDWTDLVNGDPIGDLEKAKRLVSDATEGGVTDVFVLSNIMYERLTKFDVVRNNNYLQAQVVQTGIIPGLAGMAIIKDNAIDPNDDGVIGVMRRGAFGFIGETIPLTTVATTGQMLGNPMIDARHSSFQMAEPVVDAGEFITIVTGLKA